MKNLQPIIDELIAPGMGAEIVMDGDENLGAVADVFYSPETQQVAYRVLGPWASMAYDRPFTFFIKDSSFQKDKNRLVMRSTGGHIYTLQPAQTDDALTTLANFGLDEKQQKMIRQSLEATLQ